MLAFLVAFAVCPHPAEAEDWLILNRSDRVDGSSVVKLGTWLPLGWETRLGVDLGTTVSRPGARESSAWYSANHPANIAWCSVGIPGTGWLWDDAWLEGRLNPAEERYRIGGSLAREVSLGGDLSAALQLSYALVHTGWNADPEQSWETSRSLRLNYQPTGTSFVARSRFASTEIGWHRSLQAEQRIFGQMKLVGSISDIGLESQAGRFTLNMKRRW